jgi:hypothetical protein
MLQEGSARHQFIQAFNSAFSENALLKCTLSRPGAQAAPDLKNVYLRPVLIKNTPKIAFNYRYHTRDEVKNYSLEDALNLLEQWLGSAFLHADLFTTQQDYTLSIDKKNEARLQQRPPAQPAQAPALAHDRHKQRLLDPMLPWLHTLGITSRNGDILAAAQDKWRQINKYLEIIEGLAQPLPPDAVIADMGSGKGYLTFALYTLLTQRLHMQPRVTGIELRPALVAHCNELAEQAGYAPGLDFVAQDIRAYRTERLDMLIALHACDIATDLALAKGIQGGASVIVVAPCCHKQIRREMATANELAPLMRHGILEERQAEIITDGIRALLLEANGYKTQVFEFISTEHTAKNVMITAVKSGAGHTAKQRSSALERVAALKQGFGIAEHYLETLLK